MHDSYTKSNKKSNCDFYFYEKKLIDKSEMQINECMISINADIWSFGRWKFTLVSNSIVK